MKKRAICQYEIQSDNTWVRFDISNGVEQLYYVDVVKVLPDGKNEERYKALEEKAESHFRDEMAKKAIKEEDLIDLPIYKQMNVCDFERFDK